MNDEPTCTFDQAVLSAWQDELKATGDATLEQQCLEREPDLLPRFTDQYRQLKTLPRRMRRGLQRQWKRSLAGVALLLALGQAPALAATINVGGTCTLVRAINAANSDTTAGGNCIQGSGADTIVLPANSTQTLTAVNNIRYGPTGLPAIRSIITIAGNNSTIRRAASAPEFRILAVGQNGNLTLRQTQVTGGSLAGDSGGGMFNNKDGILKVTNSTISGNTAKFGGGLRNDS